MDSEAIASNPKTSNEVKECCKDIKVLGRKELRSLLSWWKVLHEEYVKSNANTEDDANKQEEDEEEKSEKGESDDDEAIDKKIQELKVKAL